MIPHSPFPEVYRPSAARNREADVYGRLEQRGRGGWVVADARATRRRLAMLRAVSALAALFRRG